MTVMILTWKLPLLMPREDCFGAVLADDMSASAASGCQTPFPMSSLYAPGVTFGIASGRRPPICGAAAQLTRGSLDGECSLVGELHSKCLLERYWLTVRRENEAVFDRLTPATVWHEIRGLIKGSVGAFKKQIVATLVRKNTARPFPRFARTATSCAKLFTKDSCRNPSA